MVVAEAAAGWLALAAAEAEAAAGTVGRRQGLCSRPSAQVEI